jgi:hypothetical protein
MQGSFRPSVTNSQRESDEFAYHENAVRNIFIQPRSRCQRGDLAFPRLRHRWVEEVELGQHTLEFVRIHPGEAGQLVVLRFVPIR